MKSAEGSPPETPSTGTVVLFEPGAEPRVVYYPSGSGREPGPIELPSLKQGRYEFWLPRFKALAAEQMPTAPLTRHARSPVDVEWRADASVESDEGAPVDVPASGAVPRVVIPRR